MVRSPPSSSSLSLDLIARGVPGVPGVPQSELLSPRALQINKICNNTLISAFFCRSHSKPLLQRCPVPGRAAGPREPGFAHPASLLFLLPFAPIRRESSSTANRPLEFLLLAAGLAGAAAAVGLGGCWSTPACRRCPTKPGGFPRFQSKRVPWGAGGRAGGRANAIYVYILKNTHV